MGEPRDRAEVWVSEDSLGWRLCREALFQRGSEENCMGSKERRTGTSLRGPGWGAPSAGDLRGQRSKGGKRLGAGLLRRAAGRARPRRSGRGLPQGSAGGQGGGRDRLRPLQTNPEPPQGAPEVFVAGRHLLQQAGDVEGTGTHAGCAAGCGSNRIWRPSLPSPQPRPLPHRPRPFALPHPSSPEKD